MKQFLLVFTVVVGALAYSIKCPKCYEGRLKGYSVSIATRDFTKGNIEKDGKIYAVYHCMHGHTILVEIK